jgi:hypothetical protein
VLWEVDLDMAELYGGVTVFVVAQPAHASGRTKRETACFATVDLLFFGVAFNLLFVLIMVYKSWVGRRNFYKH